MARVLVVDDQPNIACVLELFLTRHGHDVVRADNGKKALNLLQNQLFDILITDVDMPEMDGLTLVSHHGVIDQLCGVIILTGRTDNPAISKAMSNDKICVEPKPLSPTRTAALIEKLLKSTHVIQSS